MVRSPWIFEISVALNLSFQRMTATVRTSGSSTNVGSSAIARSRSRTDRPRTRPRTLPTRLYIPQCALAVDRLARDAEPARGLVLVAAGLAQHRKNVPPLHLGEALGCGAGRAFRQSPEVVGEHTEDQGALDQVAQLAHVARPVV